MGATASLIVVATDGLLRGSRVAHEVVAFIAGSDFTKR
jgi:hypothetical protein